MGISEISNRSNVIKKCTSENNVIIYEDHRTILNVLFILKEAKGLNEPLDIITFDYHDDYCHPKKKAIENIHAFLQNPSIEELYRIVEFDLSTMDDDWVKAGMELGLIGNVFLFNSEQSSIGFREEYQTKNFGVRYLYNIGDVWTALGHRGILNDPIMHENQALWDDLGWEYTSGKFQFKKDRKKFVFDIDLDCFSTRLLDKTIAIPEELIVPKLTDFHQPSYHNYYSSQDFMKDLISSSELVTICFETGCCGGIRQAYKIFNMIDDILFDNELGS